MDVRISVEQTNEVDRSIKIEVPRGLYSGEFDRRLSQTASRVQLKGFRPGRAPRAMVAKLYGDRIHAEVMEGIVSNALDTAIKDHSLKVVGRPSVTIEKDEKDSDLAIRADLSVYPEPTIVDYEGISFEAPVEKVTEEMKADRLEQIRNQAASFNEKQSGVAQGDVAVLDYHGSSDGEEQKALHKHNVVAELGSDRLDPLTKLLESELLGMTVGEEKKVNLSIPEDFAVADLAGKECEVTMKLTALYEKALPDLDDEFAKKNGFVETLDEMKQRIAEAIEAEVSNRNKRSKESALYQTIVEKNPFLVPQHLVDEEIRTMLVELRFLDPKDRRASEMDVSGFRDSLGVAAEQRVKQVVAMDRIIDQEKVEVSDEDLEAWLDKLAGEEGQPRADFNNQIGYPSKKWWFKHLLCRERLTERLLEKASITETVREPK